MVSIPRYQTWNPISLFFEELYRSQTFQGRDRKQKQLKHSNVCHLGPRFVTYLSQMSLSFFIWVLWLSSARLVSRSVSCRNKQTCSALPDCTQRGIFSLFCVSYLAFCRLGVISFCACSSEDALKSQFLETVVKVSSSSSSWFGLTFYHFDVFPLQVLLTVVLFLPQSQKLLLLLVSQLLEALVLLAVGTRAPGKHTQMFPTLTRCWK